MAATKWTKARRIALVVFVSATVCFGLAMLDPYFRQWVFGPRFGGGPLAAWEAFFDEPDPKLGIFRRYLHFMHGVMQLEPTVEQWKRLPPPDRARLMTQLARHPSMHVRKNIADWLGQLPMSDALEPIATTLLADPHPRVAHAAIAAALTTKPLRPKLRDAAWDQVRTRLRDNDEIKLSVLKILARMSDVPGDIVDVVRELAESRDAEISAIARRLLRSSLSQ